MIVFETDWDLVRLWAPLILVACMGATTVPRARPMPCLVPSTAYPHLALAQVSGCTHLSIQHIYRVLILRPIPRHRQSLFSSHRGCHSFPAIFALLYISCLTRLLSDLVHPLYNTLLLLPSVIIIQSFLLACKNIVLVFLIRGQPAAHPPCTASQRTHDPEITLLG